MDDIGPVVVERCLSQEILQQMNVKSAKKWGIKNTVGHECVWHIFSYDAWKLIYWFSVNYVYQNTSSWCKIKFGVNFGSDGTSGLSVPCFIVDWPFIRSTTFIRIMEGHKSSVGNCNGSNCAAAAGWMDVWMDGRMDRKMDGWWWYTQALWLRSINSTHKPSLPLGSKLTYFLDLPKIEYFLCCYKLIPLTDHFGFLYKHL